MTASAGTGQPGTEATIVLHKYLKALTADARTRSPTASPSMRAGAVSRPGRGP
jgi:hypothetical protein